MSNELDVYSNGSDIQPYDPGMPVLAPLSPSPDTWGRTDIDTLTPREIDSYQRSSGQVQLFGAAMPSGTTNQQAMAVLTQLGGVYMTDMGALNYPSPLIQSALQFINSNATKAPYEVRRQHNFKLPDDLAGDWLAESFGNHLSGLSGTQAQKQQFLTASLQWLAKACKKLNSGSEPVAQGRAPSSTESLLNQLSEADYNKVIDINNKALANTMQVLQQRWGEYTYRQNIAIAQDYLNNLPANERAVFDQFTTVNGTSWVHMRNTVETLTFLFDAATGAHSLPKDGKSIAQEIAQIEALMRDPAARRAYMRDPQLQARYRTLLQMRG